MKSKTTRQKSSKRRSPPSMLIVSIVLLIVAAASILGFVLSNHRHSLQSAQVQNRQVYQPNYSGTRTDVSSVPYGAGAKVSLVIPDGWVFEKRDFQDGLLFADDLKYTPGTKFSLTDASSNKDISRFMLSAGTPDLFPKEYNTYQKSAWEEVSGIKVTQYYHQFSKGETIGNVTMQGGEKEYMYSFVYGGEDLTVSYYVLAGDKDNKAFIDQVIRSIVISRDTTH